MATSTQKLLSSCCMKTLSMQDWKYKQVAFARQVNSSYNYLRAEVILYAFGNDAQTRLDEVADQIAVYERQGVEKSNK